MSGIENVHFDTLRRQLADGKLSRREFLRTATLVGVSAAAAYSAAGLQMPTRASAATPKTGGTVRVSMACQDLTRPHGNGWLVASNSYRQSLDYLTYTGRDNVTVPALLQDWQVSDDLKTWTLNVRKDINWRKGRKFTADDVLWNLKRLVDPAVGSSTVGLMKGFLLEDYDTDDVDDKGNKKKGTRLWDASAMEKKDDFTILLNGKLPQLAVPEMLFHFQAVMMDPEENGEFGVGSNGTGAYVLEEYEVGRRNVYRRHDAPYWNNGAYVDRIEFIDFGGDQSAEVGALAAGQVDGQHTAGTNQYDVLSQLPNLQFYQVVSGDTVVLRMQPSAEPFTDKRVRQAMRYAVDCGEALQAANRGVGAVGEHHHVAPVHPDYAQLPPLQYDVDRAKSLLADAGHAGGIDVELTFSSATDWYLLLAQNLVEQWAKADIRVKLNPVPSTLYWESWTKVPFGITPWSHRPLGVMTLGLAYRSGAPWNESNWSNPDFDRLLGEAESTLDIEKRRLTMAELEKIMQDDGPVVQPFWRPQITFMDKKVKGFDIHPSIYLFAHEWWTEEA